MDEEDDLVGEKAYTCQLKSLTSPIQSLDLETTNTPPFALIALSSTCNGKSTARTKWTPADGPIQHYEAIAFSGSTFRTRSSNPDGNGRGDTCLLTNNRGVWINKPGVPPATTGTVTTVFTISRLPRELPFHHGFERRFRVDEERKELFEGADTSPFGGGIDIQSVRFFGSTRKGVSVGRNAGLLPKETKLRDASGAKRSGINGYRLSVKTTRQS